MFSKKNYLQKSLIFHLSSITIYNFKTPDKMLKVRPPQPNKFMYLPCCPYQLHEIENHGFGGASHGIQRSYQVL